MKQNLFSGGKFKPQKDLTQKEFARELEAIGKREHGPPVDPNLFRWNLQSYNKLRRDFSKVSIHPTRSFLVRGSICYNREYHIC